MAKETKAEREASRVRANEVYLAERRETYPQRLMDAMARALKFNFELSVEQMSFKLRDRDERYTDSDHYLDYQYSEDADFRLSTFEWAVERKEEAERESNRRFLAKQVALAKLTEEEKELLELK